MALTDPGALGRRRRSILRDLRSITGVSRIRVRWNNYCSVLLFGRTATRGTHGDLNSGLLPGQLEGHADYTLTRNADDH